MMKRKISICALVLAVLMCFLTVSAFAATEDNASSQMPFVETDEISPEYPDIQTEEDAMEVFEDMFGEGGGVIFVVAMIGVLSMSLFLPALVLVIVFGVLNSKTKKKVKKFERFFVPVPQNAPRNYIPNTNNVAYQGQPVNPTGAPMGTAPAGNPYVPQNDINNQQGGSFNEKH